MKERWIKRYANRKMYDVEKSTYVSLSDIAELVKSGETVRVTDKNGDKDFTAQILRQIILEQTREDEQSDPAVSALHEWIRAGGEFLDEQWDEWRNNMEEWVKNRAPRMFKGMTREEFDALKKKVDLLESKIRQLDNEKS